MPFSIVTFLLACLTIPVLLCSALSCYLVEIGWSLRSKISCFQVNFLAILFLHFWSLVVSIFLFGTSSTAFISFSILVDFVWKTTHYLWYYLILFSEHHSVFLLRSSALLNWLITALSFVLSLVLF